MFKLISDILVDICQYVDVLYMLVNILHYFNDFLHMFKYADDIIKYNNIIWVYYININFFSDILDDCCKCINIKKIYNKYLLLIIIILHIADIVNIIIIDIISLSIWTVINLISYISTRNNYINKNKADNYLIRKNEQIKRKLKRLHRMLN